MVNSYILQIDIAHPPLPSAKAETELTRILSRAIHTKTIQAIKVIHGYGSTGHGGVLKEVVQNWAYRNRKHIRAVIPGEEYGIFDPATQELRELHGAILDEDLDQKNPGITIIRID